MKMYTLLLMLSLSIFHLFPQKILLQDFDSPANFNQSTALTNNLDKVWITIFENKLNKLQSVLEFYDRQGNTLKTIPVGNQSYNKAVIDYEYNRAIVYKHKIIENPYSDHIKTVELYHSEVYDSAGNLIFSFKDKHYWLLPFSKKLFLGTSMDGEMESLGKSILVDLNGRIISEIHNLWTPRIKTRNNQLVIVNDIIKQRLWTFDQNGNILWKKDIRISEWVSISDNGRICFSPNKSIVVLDKNGNIIDKISVHQSSGTIQTQISKSGNYIFWIYTSGGIFPNIKNEMVLFNLQNHKRIWEITTNSALQRTGVAYQFGIIADGEYCYVLFHNSGVFIIISKTGVKIYEENLNAKGGISNFHIQQKNEVLLIQNKENSRVKLIMFGE